MYTYGNYRYIGDVDSTKSKMDYAFNKQYYDDLIADNRYQDAANYLSNYEFTDVERQKQQLSDIENIRRQGKIVEAVYKKVEDPAMLRRIEEADLIGTPGAYDRLRYKKDASGSLLYNTEEQFEEAYPLMAKYKRLLDSVGSTKDNQATSYSLTFSNKLVGLFDIDAFAKDSSYNLNTFLNGLQMSLDDLKTKLGKENVSYNEKTGETTIYIDKNHELALPALMQIPYQTRDANKVFIQGYDKNGNKINRKIGSLGLNSDVYEFMFGTPQTINPATSSNLSNVVYSNTAIGDLYNIWEVNGEYNKQLKEKENLFKKEEFNTLEMSSTIFDLNTDKLNSIEEAYKTNKITYEQYKQMKKEAEDLLDITRDLQYVPGIYSNINNDYNDSHLSKIGQEDWIDIKNRIASTADGDISWFAQTVNGEVGLRIVLPQIAYKAKAGHTLVDVTKKEASVWIPASAIPGMMGKLQERINNDTKLQAEQDYNDMLNWRVSHLLSDGTRLSTDGTRIIRERDGVLTYDTSPNYRENAVRDLNRDRIYNGGKYIKFRHLNANNELNEDSFEANIKNAAIGAMFDLYPELSQRGLITFDGKIIGRDIPYSAIFDSEDSVLKEKNNYPDDVYKALRECREMYNRWKRDSKYYVRRNTQNNYGY